MGACLSKRETVAVLTQGGIESKKFLVLIITHIGKLVQAKAESFIAQLKERIVLFDFSKVCFENLEAVLVFRTIIKAIELQRSLMS